MRFHIETYGCTSNFGNSIQLETALISLGHLPSSIEEADVVIVNTCAVTEKTQRKILKRLKQLESDHLIIAGCLTAAIPDSVGHIKCSKRLGVLTIAASMDIAKAIGNSPSDISTGTFYREKNVAYCPMRNSLCGIINIAEGCQGSCSYCVVRRARGKLISLAPEEVERRARSMIESGVVELQLAAQDTASYGSDIGSSLPELLKRITNIRGNFMVRVGMMNPDAAKPILQELTETLRHPKIYKFIHLPVQSGSDDVLKNMHRGYDTDDYVGMVRRFKEMVPGFSFATDVIVGFPGETAEDFENTMKLMEQVRPDKINVTRYSKRPGTRAAELYDMPERIKKDRSRRLTKLWLDIASENYRLYRGTVIEALVTEKGKGNTMKARANNYTGVLINGAPPLGSLQTLKIIGTGPSYLTANFNSSETTDIC